MGFTVEWFWVEGFMVYGFRVEFRLAVDGFWG